MTTSTFTSVISHASTTTFRVWGLELSNALTAVGFIKSGDTGQINWATVTRPAVNVSGGYEIRYLNDSLHGTAPIYMKIEYGTNITGAAYPAMWVTIGTGSNGSGTITGTIIAREELYLGNFVLDSTVATKTSYACMVTGCVWMAHKCKVRGTYYPAFSWLLTRTWDSSGAATADGMVFYRTGGNGTNYAAVATVYIFSTGYTDSSDSSLQLYGGGYSFMPYGMLNKATIVSGVPGDYQVARHYTVTPTIAPLVPIVDCSIVDGVTQGTTFTCTPVGASARTFIAVGHMFCVYGQHGLIWE